MNQARSWPSIAALRDAQEWSEHHANGHHAAIAVEEPPETSTCEIRARPGDASEYLTEEERTRIEVVVLSELTYADKSAGWISPSGRSDDGSFRLEKLRQALGKRRREL